MRYEFGTLTSEMDSSTEHLIISMIVQVQVENQTSVQFDLDNFEGHNTEYQFVLGTKIKNIWQYHIWRCKSQIL